MARDKGLEELVSETLGAMPGLTQKAMFGGLAWLLNGNLLCGAGKTGMLVRLGKDNDGWALKIRGIAPMIMQGRRTNGWVRAAPEVCGDDALRRKLITAALDFNRALPKK
jgi:TfoX N-terminal domain